MGYSGLAASEQSSGGKVHRGAITKSGNAHLRRVLVEASWSYHHRPNVTGFLLRPGMAADLVVFDPATVKDEATFEDPHRLSTGISQVVVNGEIVVLNGKHTGAKPGQILRGPGYGHASVTK